MTNDLRAKMTTPKEYFQSDQGDKQGSKGVSRDVGTRWGGGAVRSISVTTVIHMRRWTRVLRRGCARHKACLLLIRFYLWEINSSSLLRLVPPPFVRGGPSCKESCGQGAIFIETPPLCHILYSSNWIGGDWCRVIHTPIPLGATSCQRQASSPSFCHHNEKKCNGSNVFRPYFACRRTLITDNCLVFLHEILDAQARATLLFGILVLVGM